MEMTLELMFVVLIVVTLLTIFFYLIYSGLFTNIEVRTSEPSTGAMTLAYKTLVGPYKNVGEIFTESYCLLPQREQLGIYYDDPEGVPASDLRCAVGPVLAKGDEEPVPEEMEKMKKNGFKIVHLPKPPFVVTATFPFTTTISIYLGIYRVYPKLRDYIAEKKLCAYPALELYNDTTITFMMPLSQQDEFFVSEFQEDEVSVATTDVGDTDKDSAVAADFVIPEIPQDEGSNKSASTETERSEQREDSTDIKSGATHSRD